MNFREAESYLLSLGNEVETMKLGLDNIRTLLDALGNPQNNYLKVQVAGTNGKGSVCAFLDAICNSSGIKTGVFTSPHLVSISERVRINGEDISEADLARHATVVRKTAERLLARGELEYMPTYFEQVTAIALVAFAEAGVELAILETGLGGRLDATTAANAEIAAITRIDLDHQEHLGHTLAEIAAEKAAIIRPDSTVVIGDQVPDAMTAIRTICDRNRVEPLLAEDLPAIGGGNTSGSECVQREYNSARTHTLPVMFPPLRASPITLGLAGRHQIENAKVAILLAEILREYFPITTENIINGLENARHPGRLEFWDRFLFDGAHNIGGATALREFLDEFVTQPITLIFGVVKDKDIAGMAQLLFPKAGNVILTKIRNSRSMAAEEIASSLPKTINATNLHVASDAGEALAKANEITDDDGLIVVTGSLYLIGEVKKILNN